LPFFGGLNDAPRSPQIREPWNQATFLPLRSALHQIRLFADARQKSHHPYGMSDLILVFDPAEGPSRSTAAGDES
jgi:hypothetical protein